MANLYKRNTDSAICNQCEKYIEPEMGYQQYTYSTKEYLCGDCHDKRLAAEVALLAKQKREGQVLQYFIETAREAGDIDSIKAGAGTYQTQMTVTITLGDGVARSYKITVNEIPEGEE